jgi:hypothetical protein
LFSQDIKSAAALSRPGKHSTPAGSLVISPTAVTCKAGTKGSQVFTVSAEVTSQGPGTIRSTLTFDGNGRLTASSTAATQSAGDTSLTASAISTFRYVPVTIARPSADTYVSKGLLEKAVAGVKVRAAINDAAATVVSFANADRRATAQEIRFFARQLCRASGGRPAPCTVSWVSGGAHISASDPYTGGRYAANVIVKNGKAVRK